MALLVNGQSLSKPIYNGTQIKNAYFNGNKIWSDRPVLEFQFQQSDTDTTRINGTVTPKKTIAASVLEYSIDNQITWQTWSSGAITSVNNGSIFFRGTGDGLFGSQSTTNNPWTISGFCKVIGDLSALLTTPTTPPANYAFAQMFYNCSGLLQAPTVSGIKYLSNYIFRQTFANCTSLVNLSNMTLPWRNTITDYCFYGMFSGCTNLLYGPPELPSTTLKTYCYYNMYNGCTSLKATPTIPTNWSPSTSGCCYAMFQNCSSLTSNTIPSSLSSSTLGSSCYTNMFSGCTGITTLPSNFLSLTSSTTLASSCYSNMFSGCTSLTNAPDLPPTTLKGSCYRGMFNGCTSLTSTPFLPATTLDTECYAYMFSNCTSLIAAKLISATTFDGSTSANYASYMFKGCTNLSKIEIKITAFAGNGVTTISWVEGVASSGSFYCPSALANTRGINYIPTNWTKVNN